MSGHDEDVRSDDQLADEVRCFGRYWDPSEALCANECAIQERCIRRIALAVLPAISAAKEKSINALVRLDLEASGVSISEEALRWCRRVNADPELGAPPRAAEPAPAPPEPPEPPEEPEEDDEPDDTEDEPEEPEEDEGPTKPERPTEARAEPGRPRRAKHQGRKKGGGRGKKAGRSKPQKPPKLWGPHTFPARWMRERARNRLVACVPIGWTLSRVWKGEIHTTTCREGFWEYRDQKLPTLYSVVEAITGVRRYPPQKTAGVRPEHRGMRAMAAWSARRFFQLDLALSKHGLHPDQQPPGTPQQWDPEPGQDG